MAKDYELAQTWLIDCGLAYKIPRVSRPGIPLKAYEDESAFKFFMVDIGLLAAKANINAKTILEGNEQFAEFKGALTEQYVLQQLVSTEDYEIYYWSAGRTSAEVDFVVHCNGLNIPIEVKRKKIYRQKDLKGITKNSLPNFQFAHPCRIFQKRSGSSIYHFTLSIP